MYLFLQLLDLVLQLYNLGSDLVNLVVSRQQHLTIVNKLHFNIIWAAMKELIEHILEDLILTPSQVDLTILLLNSKNFSLKLDLLNKRLQERDINDSSPTV